AAAEATVAETREQAKQQVATLEQKLMAAAKAQKTAETRAAELQKTLENTTQAIAVERASTANELKKLKQALADKEKEIKAINTALSDTPENVLKKMNALKKERRAEADLRKQEEATANALRADKRKLEQQLADTKKISESLATKYRDLHALCVKLRDQLKEADSKAKLPEVPDLDEKLLETLEQGEEEAAPKKKRAQRRGISD